MSDEQKRETHLDNGVEIPALTSKPKKLVLGVLMGIFIVYLLINIFWDKPKKDIHKNIDQNPISNITSYSIPKVENEIDKENNTNDVKKPDPSKNTKEENDEEKLLLLRQHAPIQMFVAQSKNSTQEKDVVSVGSQPVSNAQNTINQNNDLENKPNNVINESAAQNTTSHLANDPATQVKRLKHRDYLLLEGTIIPGFLKTALHSDLSGNLKAQVSEDVYASTGRRILIPKGSELLGHYSNSTTQAQSRLFVVWTRIIRPDGISVQLQAEGTDELGQAGLTGNVNHHYIARFGQASLLSLIGLGVAGTAASPSQNYTASLANSFATTSQNSLQESMQIKPTITIKAGTPISVYANQDISFYGKIK